MLKKMAWNTFKNTGDINTMMELLEVDNIEKHQVKDDIINFTNNYEKNYIKEKFDK